MAKDTPRVAFIGGGNMAASFISGLLKAGWPAARLAVADADPRRRAALAGFGDIEIDADNAVAGHGAALVVIAVKPSIVPAALASARSALRAGMPVLLSIAAGVRMAVVESAVGNDPAVARAMPNLPALIGRGVSAVCANPRVTDDARKLIHQVLGAVGDVVEVDNESSLDAVTAVSGSGPAYFFLFVEALVAAAVAEGLAPEIARQLVLGTGRGALELLEQSREEPAALRERVTSPGGTTAAALEVFAEADFRLLVARAIASATVRARELGTQLEEGGT